MKAATGVSGGTATGTAQDLMVAQGVSLRLGDRELFSDLTLTLRSGEHVGLVGANGSGKTTLLRLLAGTLKPSEGRIASAPGLRLGVSLQTTANWRGTLWQVAAESLEHVQNLERDLRRSEHALSGDEALARYGDLTSLFEEAGGYEAESTLQAYLERLGLTPADYERDVRTLSGGERARLGLARALAARPELLLLDEPSLYLDLPGTRWLADTLRRFRGALLLASHDRALLDSVTTRTLHLTGGKTTSYRGNYNLFQRQTEHQAARALREARRLAHERRSLAVRAAQQPTLSARRSLERRLERLPDAPEPMPSQNAPTLDFDAASVRRGSRVLETRHLNLTLGGRTLLEDVSLALYAGDKVALVGPNSSGKTSLLRLLTGELEPDEREPEAQLSLGAGVRLVLFDQHGRGLDDGLTLGESLERSVSPGRARSLLALVGLNDAFDRTPETLSSGQRARAGLAGLMASRANLLILDEPSEGLDIGSLETLQNALEDTTATLLFVTHDAALIEAVATRVLGLADGRVHEYRGGLAGYYAGTLRLETDLPEEPPLQDAPPAPKRLPTAELEALEDESQGIEDLLADPLRLSARERARLEGRYRDLTELRAEHYDAPLPPPLPRYRVLEGGLTLTTNANTAPIVLTGNEGVTLHLYIDEETRIGHLTLPSLDESMHCLLPWAETALIRGTLRLAFEHLEVRVVQLQSERNLSGAGLASAGAGWWALDRERYAEREGLIGPSRPTPAKRRRRRQRRKKVTS